MIRILIPLITLGCFCVLSSYSWGVTHAPVRHVMEDRAVKTRPVHLWRTAKAAQIADIWGITPEEASKPVRIFGN